MSYSGLVKLKVENPRDFDPAQAFDCGQCFRWEPAGDGAWEGVVGCGRNWRRARLEYDKAGGIISIHESGPACETKAGQRLEDGEAFWRHYFDLDRDYGQIKQRLAEGDPIMAKAIEFGSGIRILKQDAWETIVSFIISQNNNIPRIKKCIRSVAEQFGDQGVSLPTPETRAKAVGTCLGECRLGYRAGDLVKAANQVLGQGMPNTRDELLGLCGVGPKVANCIDLFGLGNADSFPIDVLMKRVMNQLSSIPENDAASMQKYACEHFAPYGGIAQQYLFYYITHK